MFKPLSNEYLDAVRKRCQNATPGPWVASIEGRDHRAGENIIFRGVDGTEDALYLFGGTDADYDFVAWARQDIPLLLDEIERLKNLLNNATRSAT
jgi:hypothetical protein